MIRNILLVGSSIINRFLTCNIDGYQIINKGVERALTSDFLTNSYLQKLRSFVPDIPTIETSPSLETNYEYMIYYCGNNDIKHGIVIDEIIQNINRFIFYFQQMFPTTKIIILSLLFSPENYRRNISTQIYIIF